MYYFRKFSAKLQNVRLEMRGIQLKTYTQKFTDDVLIGTNQKETKHECLTTHECMS